MRQAVHVFPAAALISGLLFCLVACGPVLSKNLTERANASVTPAEAVRHPAAYRGTVVIWGGVIANTVNVAAGTRIEVVQKPLGYRQEPESTDESEGRFLVTTPRYLDPIIYAKHRKITVGGALSGVQRLPMGETTYDYPVVAAQEIYLWPRQRPRPPGMYPPYPGCFYDPWFGSAWDWDDDPWCGPWPYW